jgi:hypothetical protein
LEDTIMLPGHNPTHDNRALSSALLGAVMAATTLAAGCGTTALPCMQYQPQMVTRTVSMRGQGTFQVMEQAMVCTQRASSMEEGLIGP